MRFSFTLFRYVFIDLLRVFMMAVGALSGILSFGGMLRPLMQQGLDASQVAAMLTYFGPAMTAYALPIGALFATTVIYGRLSADNEVVACRAGGISHLSMAAPAFVLGLLVSMLALGLLLFVVPLYTLKVEQVVTSNIAQLIASRINRSHNIRFGAATVFANQAYIPAPDPKQPQDPRVQTVVLESPTIVTYVDRTLGLIVHADSKATAEAMQKLLTDSMARGEIKGRILSVEVGPVTKADVERAAAINGSEPERLAEQRAAARANAKREKVADPDARRAEGQAAREGDPSADVTEAIVVAVKSPVDADARRLADERRVDVRNYKSDVLAMADLKRERRFKVPKDFHLAKQATVRIYPDAGGEQMLLAIGLEQGSKFPREFVGAQQAGVDRAQFGPMPIPSPIKENTKFMDIWQLQRLFRNGDESRRIRGIVEDYVHRDQMFAYLHHLRDDLNDADGQTVLHGDQTYLLERQRGATSYEKLGELIVTNSDPKDAAKRVRFRITGDRRGGNSTTNVAATSMSIADDDVVLAAREARLTAKTGGDQADIDIEFYDVEMLSRDGSTPRRSARYGLTAPLPPAVAEMEHRTVRDYGPGGQASAANPAAHQRLVRELTVLGNDIQSETWSRISFSVSCLVLVLVGTALGMMFKSGNFLSAFAVSFIPALLSITLIIAGQRVCGSVPFDYPKHPNPLQLGLSLIWTGNAVNFLLACGLWWRLQRQ